MQCLKRLCTDLIAKTLAVTNANVTSRGIKYFPPPPDYDDIQLPDNYKLKFYEKVPQYNNIRPPKMQKRLRYMRGPELIHNKLIHKQYGVQALTGGRLKFEHFELIRMGVLRKLDPKRMFAIWRVDPPWQPVTKKSQGMRMGGGKGAIDHYVTPIKADRIIFEVAGKCEFDEVKSILEGIACRLPFAAVPVSQELLEKKEAKKKMLYDTNLNPYTFEFCIKNNMLDCHRWLSKYDHKWFGQYR